MAPDGFSLPEWAIWLEWAVAVLTLPAVLFGGWQLWRVTADRPRVVLRARGTQHVLHRGETRAKDWLELNPRFEIVNRNATSWEDLDVRMFAAKPKSKDFIEVPWNVEDRKDTHGRRTVTMQVGIAPEMLQGIFNAVGGAQVPRFLAKLSLPGRRTVRFMVTNGILAPKIAGNVPFLLRVEIAGGPVEVCRWFLVDPKAARAKRVGWWKPGRGWARFIAAAYRFRRSLRAERWSHAGERAL